jgi:hypothetical protein
MSTIIDNLILTSRDEILYDKLNNNSGTIGKTKLHINAAIEVEQLFSYDNCVQINLNWNDQPLQNINQNGILFILVKLIDSYLKDNKQVLVNCFAGVSRSTTIVIAYLMYKNKWSVYDAISYVRCKRFIIEPNYGFICQLYNMQDKLHNLDENFLQYCSEKDKTVDDLSYELMETCKLPLIEILLNHDDRVIIL